MTPVCLGLELMLFGARLCLGDAGAPPPIAVISCPQLEAWSAEEQHALAGELRAHPTPVTISAIKRLQRVRAQIRACLRAQRK
jgi:hypothetical protein